MESDELTRRPDDTRAAGQKAEYERIKAECLAEMSAAPAWVDEPTVPADDLIDLLDRLVKDSQSRGGKA